MSRLSRPSLLAVLAILAGALQAGAANEAAFAEKLVPVLEARCASCHQGASAAGKLEVTSYSALVRGGKLGPAIVPGKAAESLLIHFVRGTRAPRMPLGGEPLPEETIAALEAAIDAMAPLAKDHRPQDEYLEWLFTPPKAPEPAPVSRQDWIANPIDAFVLARLDKQGLAPAPPASRRDLIRRAYFDLLGLPPAPEEVRTFVEDKDPKAWENLIDRLLADPRYGERWGRHWLDLARYAESDGYAVDRERPTAWRYRDYVIRSFNNDKPYDLFVKEQIAGDEVNDPRAKREDQPERLVALGFLRMGTWEIDANSKKKLRQDFLNDMTNTVGSVFLGVTVGCAQCHNHKYDPIPQTDYYRLQSFFAATAIQERPAPFTEAEDPEAMKRLARQYEDERDRAVKELERRKDLLVKRFMEIKSVPEDDQQVKDFLRELNVANNFFQEREDRIFHEPVWHSYLEARDNQRRLDELVNRYQPVAYGVADLVPPLVPELPVTHLLVSGELDAKGPEVEPGFLEAVEGKAEPAKVPFVGGSSGRRLALANWIASKDNPLTARVMVNRIWQQHFGEGIVRTSSDLGKNGDRASHPELLDWLATRFVERDWSIKAMHRLILTSNTYRQSVEHPEWETYSKADPENRLLWRANWRRLDAESLRDSILTISGRLNPSRGGPGALLEVPDDVAEGFEFFKWFPSPEPDQRKRSVYTFQRRSVVMPILETFDVANMNESCARRSATTVAPQALTLANGKLTNDEARHLAERVIETVGADRGRQVEYAFELALGRAPAESEKAKALELLAAASPRDGLTRLGVVLFNLNEFLYLK